MGADPIRQRLAPARFGVSEVRRPEGCDEDASAPFLTGRRIGHADRVSGPVDEQLLARHMRLPHRRRDALFPPAVALAKPAVGEALGLVAAILLPEQRQRDPAPLHLGMDPCPVRLSAHHRRRGSYRRKQSPLQLGIVDPVRDWPADSGDCRAADIVADRRLADPRRLSGQPPAHPQRVRQPQHVTYFPHRHSLRRHRSPPWLPGSPIR